MSSLIIGLQRLGISFFSFHVISVPGRRTGQMRTTVVSPFVVEGKRYVLSFGQLDWVRNARASGLAILSRSRKQEKVALVEIKAPQSRAIVREFPRQIPAGAQFFVRLGLVENPAGPDQFEMAADRLALFRIDPSNDAGWRSNTAP
jgi:hypothetical protein